jgi:hypothetical protein
MLATLRRRGIGRAGLIGRPGKMMSDIRSCMRSNFVVVALFCGLGFCSTRLPQHYAQETSKRLPAKTAPEAITKCIHEKQELECVQPCIRVGSITLASSQPEKTMHVRPVPAIPVVALAGVFAIRIWFCPRDTGTRSEGYSPLGSAGFIDQPDFDIP